MKGFALLLALFASVANVAALSVGDAFPDLSIDQGFPPKVVSLKDRLAGKKTILVGLPGAFTPTWSTQQVPGYLEAQEELKAKGVDEVLVFCVNDGAVMDAWGEDQKIGDSMITFLADPRSEVTGALGMILDHPGPISKLGYNRSKRFAMYIVNGVIKVWKVSEAEGDPAGDDDPSATLAGAMIAEIEKLAPSDREL